MNPAAACPGTSPPSCGMSPRHGASSASRPRSKPRAQSSCVSRADTIKLHVGERLRVIEDKVVRFAHDILSFDNFTIRLLDERSGKLELVMSKGLPPEAMEVELYAKAEGNGISGYVAATGRPYICTDTQD